MALMVKLAAFLLILVLLFGVEGARNMVFGFLGGAAWVVFWFLVVCVGICFVDFLRKDLKQTPEEKAKNKLTKQDLKDGAAGFGGILWFYAKIALVAAAVLVTCAIIGISISLAQK